MKWDEFQELLKRTEVKKWPSLSVQNGNIVLSKEDFKKLVMSLIPPPPPPTEATITKALYKVRIFNDFATIQAHFILHLVNPDRKTLKVSLFPAQSALHDGFLDDSPALISLERGQYQLTTNRHGRHELRFTFSVQTPKALINQKVSFPIIRTP